VPFGMPPRRPAVTTADKLAVVQTLLDAMVGEIPIDATVVLSGTLGHADDKTNDASVAARRIPSLVLAGRSFEALAACHIALAAAEGAMLQNTLRPKIVELRKLLERELLTSQEIDLVSAGGRMHLLPRRSVLIGRPSSERSVDVAVNCRWLSRGDRNLSLFCEGTNWFVEDLGSTNGSSIQGHALKPGNPVALPAGETRIEIGASDTRPALATVHLHRPAKDPGAVAITLSGRPGQTNGKTDPWPSMHEDMARKWIVFREQVGISVSEDCAVRLRSGQAGILAALRYQSGFWIVPSSRCAMQIDGVELFESAPLPVGATLSIGGANLKVEPSNPLPFVPDTVVETRRAAG
jgi:hypothetical protein